MPSEIITHLPHDLTWGRAKYVENIQTEPNVIRINRETMNKQITE